MKLGKGYIFTGVCDSVHGGGVCLSACWDTTPPPPPPWSTAYWEIWSTSGRYASYWNAILVAIILRDLILLVDLKGRPSDLQILGLLKSLFTFFLQTTDLSTPATKVVEETILEKYWEAYLYL